MPSTINGIGTTYYGKNNLYQYRGECGHCKKEVVLSSYDTTMYFVFLFIPLVPLQKRRIIEYCPRCRRHRYVTLENWKKQKTEAFARVREVYERDPSSVAAAKEAIGTFFAYQDKDALLEFVPRVLAKLGENPEILNRVAAAYSNLGDLGRAEELYRASLDIERKPETRERLARILIREGRPNEAAPHLQHILDEEIPDKAGYLFALVEGYQAQGEHGNAIYVLDRLATMIPLLGKDKKFAKIRKISEQNLHTGKRIGGETKKSAGLMIGPERSGGAKVAKLVAPLLLLVAILVYLGVAVSMGRSRTVYLVNGVSKPYTAIVNGTPVSLPPLAPKRIHVEEGRIAISAKGEGLSIPDQTVEIATPFFTRPFLNRTFVINPDKSAPLAVRMVLYKSANSKAPHKKSQFLGGKNLYVVNSLDYVFQQPPESIKVSGGSRPVYKRCLVLLSDFGVSPSRIVAVLANNEGDKAAIDYLKNHVQVDPGDGIYFSYLLGAMGREKAAEFFRTGLDTRPLRMNWHRWYQTALDTPDSKYDLAGEYRKRLAADPDNSQLQYLLGRILRDPDEAMVLFRKSVEGPHPCAYGYFALAFNLRSLGEFDQALAMTRKAVEADPANPAFKRQLNEDLVLTGHYDEALTAFRQERAKMPAEETWTERIVAVEVLKGDSEGAQREMNGWLARMKGHYRLETLQHMKRFIEGKAAYVRGDFQTYLSILDQEAKADAQFWRSITQGDLESSIKALGDEEEPDPQSWLVVYIAAKLKGDQEHANRALASLPAKFRDQSWETSVFVDTLEGKRNVDPGLLCKLPVIPQDKAVLLTALGVTYPEHRDVFFSMARKLNRDRILPYLFLRSVLGEGSGAQ